MIETTNIWVKKVLFWLIFYGFLISMKKLKNRLFVKKRKKYLKCEFQKTCTFEVTCRKMIHIFQVKNMRRFVNRNTSGTIFFWYIKISWKHHELLYQNLHSTKKSWWKNDFSQITHMWSDIDFMDFWKKSIFFEFFCSNLHLKISFFVVFFECFLQKGS